MKKLVCLMLVGALALATLALDLTPYETRARKDTVPNTAQLVTDVDMVGLGNAVADAIAVSNGVFGVWFAGLFGRTNYWEGALQPASTNGWETGAHKAWLTNETDLAALRLYHYGSPDIIESPTNWFNHDGAGTIISFENQIGSGNVVIPWKIGGIEVTTIGANAFSGASTVTSVYFPRTITEIESDSFYGTTSLTSMNFSGNAVSVRYGAFAETHSNLVANVISSTSVGWGSTLSDGVISIPVVRLPLHTDSLTLGGVPRTSWPVADVSGLATTQSVNAVAGDLDLLSNDLNNHTAGTIGSDAHLQTGDRALIDSVPSLATTNALAAVSGALGTHTNDAPAHVSAADRAAWYGVTNIPSAGCTALEVTDATNLVVTGATYAYTADVTNAYWLSVAGTAPAFHYSLTVYGTNDCTLADNMRLIGAKTITGTNCVAFKPWTNGLWEVMWGGK